MTYPMARGEAFPRMATTETIVDVTAQLQSNGFRVAIDAENPYDEPHTDIARAEHVEAFDGERQIYWALRKGLPGECDVWIVRCHRDYFIDSTIEPEKDNV